jgi:hypothetical protein
VTLRVNGEYVNYVKAPPAARSIGEIAGVVEAAQKPILEDVASLCETIRYMVGIAERGSGGKCPDDMAPEVFLLRYVQRLEAALEFVARHKSSDWPERCQQMADAARSTLAAPQQAEAVPSDVVRRRAIREVADKLETLRTSAHFIFNNPPGEASQAVRDVIEWYAGSIIADIDAALAAAPKGQP